MSVQGLAAYGSAAARREREIDAELVEENGVWATPEAHRNMRKALAKRDDDKPESETH